MDNEFPELVPFRPKRWLKSGNLQTLIGAVSVSCTQPTGTVPHIVDTTQGDQLVVHENVPASQSVEGRRHVLMLHGLAGCHQSTYMALSCHKLTSAGFHVWRMDARGAGAGISLARFHHHAGRTEDLNSVIRFIRQRHSHAKISLVGFSLGGNIVLRWAGDPEIQTDGVDSVLAVAPPIDLGRCARGLKSGLSRFYDVYFANIMMKSVKQRRRARPDMINFAFVKKPDSLSEFDASFTAPAGGFVDLEDYYKRSSSQKSLKHISIRTLIIADRHDPVIPVETIQQAELSSSVRVHFTSHGGHLGYLARSGADPDQHWLVWRVLQYVQHCHDSLPHFQ